MGPNGYVLATDLSASMLSFAAQAVRTAGLTNIETRVMDAGNLVLEADSFDAVICRTALMLFPDPLKALRGMRRVMKPGAKVSALVFSLQEKNPYQGIPFTVVRRLGGAVPPMFALGERGALEGAFRDGGFAGIAVHAVSFRRHFPSAADIVRKLRGAIFIRESVAKLGDAERERAWTEIEQRLGELEGVTGLELPGELLIGVGTK